MDIFMDETLEFFMAIGNQSMKNGQSMDKEKRNKKQNGIHQRQKRGT